MKKTKYLALVLVVAIMMMGAGYAAWTDTLTVNSTVNTGYLDVDFTNVIGSGLTSPLVEVAHNIVSDGDNTYGDHKSAGSGKMANNDLLELTISNFYPGAIAGRIVTVKNEGTVPVKIRRDDFTFFNHNVVPNTLTVAVEDDITIDVLPAEAQGTEMSKADLNWANKYVNIEPGKSAAFTISFNFKSSSDNTTENQTYKYLMTLNFEQK